MSWDPGLYDSTYQYVFDYGRGLVAVLAPQPGERILDVGCGTGHLTNEIAQAGAEALGIDSSPPMIAQARQNYPKVRFQLADVVTFRDPGTFDAVFSNAALHWVREPEKAVATMRSALKAGGRLVVEFGGRGNVASILAASGRNHWYFPSIGEYAALLERGGFEVTSALLFERPTRVEGAEGLREWLAMFYKPELPKDVVDRMEQELQPRLYREGGWVIDYRRLRVTALAV